MKPNSNGTPAAAQPLIPLSRQQSRQQYSHPNAPSSSSSTAPPASSKIAAAATTLANSKASNQSATFNANPISKNQTLGKIPSSRAAKKKSLLLMRGKKEEKSLFDF